MFDITWVGVPAAIVGGLFIVVASRWLLPDRRPPISTHDDPREYTVEMQVAADGPLVGKTIERPACGICRACIWPRSIATAACCRPSRRKKSLRADDRLLFVGIVESVVDLQRIRGLLPATDQVSQARVAAARSAA